MIRWLISLFTRPVDAADLRGTLREGRDVSRVFPRLDVPTDPQAPPVANTIGRRPSPTPIRAARVAVPKPPSTPQLPLGTGGLSTNLQGSPLWRP